eukprot:229897-Chlamydomonas_euryale.AAC.11
MGNTSWCAYPKHCKLRQQHDTKAPLASNQATQKRLRSDVRREIPVALRGPTVTERYRPLLEDRSLMHSWWIVPTTSSTALTMVSLNGSPPEPIAVNDLWMGYLFTLRMEAPQRQQRPQDPVSILHRLGTCLTKR